jgi:phospholipid/cholesterol/gamma-HCH transport system substrate-binding protein
MEPDTRYSVIGAVVLALVAATVIAYLWLSSSGRETDFRFYTVYFERQSLDGLQVGGNVNMRGITVGRVEEYQIARDNINRVRVTLRVQRETPVRENTLASVSRNIVTGIARINLVTPGAPGPELVKVLDNERHPVIPEGVSGTEQITDALQRLAIGADTTLQNVSHTFSPENQKAFAELLVQVRDLARGLNERLSAVDRSALTIDESARAFRVAAQDIGGAARRIADSAQPLATQADGTLQELRSALQTLAASTRAVERDLGVALQRFDKEAAVLSRRAEDTMDVSVLELRTTTAELRSAAEAVTRTMDRWRDPRAILIGPSSAQLGPGEGRP